jgi:hypothetical protein
MYPKSTTEPKKRPVQKNPKAPQCAAHLQRTCGTCKHFSGVPMKGTALCAVHLEAVRAAWRAWDCEQWTRPTAEDIAAREAQE